MTQFEIRNAKGSDLNFITSTFLKSMRSNSRLGKSCSSRVFFAEFTQVIDHILSKASVIVANLEGEPDVVLGYLIYEPGVIHFVFVKKAWWKLGIAKALVAHAFPEAKSLIYSHQTNHARKILQDKPQHIFNPFICYKKGAA